MTKKNFLKITTYAAVFGIIGGMSFEGVTYLSDKLTSRTSVEDTVKTEQDLEENQTGDTSNNTIENKVTTVSSSSGVSDVVEDVLPSLVAIDVTATQTTTDFFGRTYEQDSTGSGSGIIVGKDDDYLYIATNNHVVAGADKVSVKFYDDKIYDAAVKGTDSTADIAVAAVKLEDIAVETMEKIKVAKLGDSDSVKVGQQAIAIGNALGYGTSVTVGYISAKDREVQSEDANMKLMQTDAAINPGNSGGALVDINGSVIGINSAKYADTDVEGMGFAIPINVAAPIIKNIIDAEEVSEEDAAYLGVIAGKEIPSEYAEYYNIPEGVFIEEVTEGAPAQKAGIQKGDIIVKFNGMEIKTMQSLQEKLALCKAGKKVEVVIKRADNGEYIEKTMEVVLGRKTDSENAGSTPSPDNGSINNSTPFGNRNSYWR
ncbi:MAG: trypsin-like peptidase domain-containing protein [Lachnospiraceae bacterium]|nr:trypsin-like peptidase domain-containing protein [Lachnospiraceae bacterium]